MPHERLVCLGAVASAHGVRGLVKLKPFTEEPEGIAAYGPLTDESGTRSFRLTLKGRLKDLLLAEIEGVTSREAAERLQGVRLYVPRERLPALDETGSYYHADLIGLAAEDKAGRPLGRVIEVQNHGAGDILVIQGEAGELLLPFTDQAVPEVDLEGGRVVCDPPVEVESGEEEGKDEG